MAREKLTVSCEKSPLAVNIPNCGSDIWMKKKGDGPGASGDGRHAPISVASSVAMSADARRNGQALMGQMQKDIALA